MIESLTQLLVAIEKVLEIEAGVVIQSNNVYRKLLDAEVVFPIFSFDLDKLIVHRKRNLT